MKQKTIVNELDLRESYRFFRNNPINEFVFNQIVGNRK